MQIERQFYSVNSTVPSSLIETLSKNCKKVIFLGGKLQKRIPKKQSPQKRIEEKKIQIFFEKKHFFVC